MRPIIVRVLVAVSIVLALMAVFSSPHQYEYVGSVPRVHALSQKTVTSHGAVIDCSEIKFDGASANFTPSTYVAVTDHLDLLHPTQGCSACATSSNSSGQGIDVGNKDTTYNRLHNGFLYGQKFTTAQFTGPLQSISFYAGENGHVSVALYSHDPGANAPLHPLTSRHTVTVTGVAYGAPKWVAVPMNGSDQIQISGFTVYWIVFDFDTNYGVCYSDNQSSGYRAWKDNWVSGTAYPDPWGTSSGTGAGYQGTVYFTYWASGTVTLPATVHRGTKWDWVVNTADAYADYQLNQADVQAMFAWPDVVAQWLVNKFGAPQYMSQRMTLELIAGSGIGGYSTPNGIGLTVGMFTIVRHGVKGGYAYQLIAHEMVNNYMTTAGGDYPPDWWADTVSPFPAATADLLEIDLNWGSSRTVGNAEINNCRQSPPVDSIACPFILMFYDQLYGQYGTGMFANAFAAMRSDGIWFRDVGGPIKTVSALRTNYVAAYLCIGANTDLSPILSGTVPNFDRQTTLDIKQARTNLQSLPRTDNRWTQYLHGSYADALIITTTTSSVSTSTAPTTTTSSVSTSTAPTTTTSSVLTSTAPTTIPEFSSFLPLAVVLVIVILVIRRKGHKPQIRTRVRSLSDSCLLCGLSNRFGCQSFNSWNNFFGSTRA